MTLLLLSTGCFDVKVYSGGEEVGTAAPDLASADSNDPNSTTKPEVEAHVVATGFQLSAVTSVTAGQPISITVNAKDDSDAILTTYRGHLTWSSTDAQAILPSDHTYTSEDLGSRSFSGIEFRTAGTHTVTVTDGTTTAVISGIVVSPSSLASVSFSQVAAGTGISAGSNFTTQPVVSAHDAYGNSIAGASIQLTAYSNAACTSAATGTLNQDSITTATNGLATFTQVKFNKTNPSLYLKASSGLAVTCAATPVSIVPGPVASVSFSTEAAATVAAGAAFTTQPVVLVKDAYDNVIAGASTVVTAYTDSTCNTGALGVLDQSTVSTGATGLATFSGLNYRKAETIYLKAAVSSITSACSLTSVSVVAGAPSTLAYSVQPGGANVTAGSSFATQPTLTLKDAYNNVVPATAVNLSAHSDSACQTSAINLNNSSINTSTSGVAAFTNTHSATAGTYYLKASAGSVSVCSTGTVTALPSAVASVQFTTQPAGTSVVANAAFSTQPVILVKDTHQNLISGTAVSLAAYSDASCQVPITGTLSGSSVNTNASGVATFSTAKFNKVATLYLKATAGTVETCSTGTVTIVPSDVASVTFSQQPAGTSVVAGAAFSTQPKVLLKDAFDNVVASSSTSIAAFTNSDCSTAATGTLGNSSASSDTSGIVTFANVNYTKALETVYLKATAGSVESACSTSGVSIVAASPASVILSQQPAGTNLQAGSAFTTVAKATVKDTYDNVVSGASVALVPYSDSTCDTSATGTLSNASATTDASGIATFTTATYSKAGDTLRFKVSTGSGGSIVSACSTGNVSFIASATPGELTFTQQPAGTNLLAGEDFTTQPKLTLKDAYGNVIASTSVTVSAFTNSGCTIAATGTLNNPTATSDASGVVTISGMNYTKAGDTIYLKGTAGSFNSACSTSTVSVIANTTPGSLVFSQQPSGTNIGTGTAFTTQPQVTVKDAYDNVIASASVTIAAYTGSSCDSSATGTLSNATATTNSSGIATFSGMSFDTSGSTLYFKATSSSVSSGCSTGSVSIASGDPAVLSDFKINSGAANSTTTSVTVNTTATNATDMYITNTAGCASGGTWVTYNSAQGWTASPVSNTATVYVKLRNAAGTETGCYSDTISVCASYGALPASSTTFSGGTGTEADPYLVTTVGQLRGVGSSSTYYAKYYKQTANLNMSCLNWTPLSNMTGGYNGNGYAISNLYVSQASANAGLFAFSSGKIKNLNIVNASITGTDKVGIFAGNMSGGTLKSSSVSGTVTSTTTGNAGGMVGYMSGAAVAAFSSANATVTTAGLNNVGGFVGQMACTGCVLARVSAQGTVTGAQYVGGLAGAASASLITQSSSSALVTGSTEVGGLVGRLTGVVSASKASGTVTGSGAYVGGLVGFATTSAVHFSYATGAVAGASEAGGLLGNLSTSSTLTQSFSTGTVTGGGGLVGAADIDSITHASFWDSQTSGASTSVTGTSKTTTQMKTASTYTSASPAWDTSTVWTISASSYPVLKWESSICSSLTIPTSSAPSGAGTVDSPYLITTVAQLNYVRNAVGSTYRLENDLDLGCVDFEPLATTAAGFTGVFEGNGKTINNLLITQSAGAGLFAKIDGGVVRHLNLTSANVIGYSPVGALTGSVASSAIVGGISVTGGIFGRTNVGGIIGSGASGSLTSLSKTDVVVSGHSYVGGVAGYVVPMMQNQSSGLIAGDFNVGGYSGFVTFAAPSYMNSSNAIVVGRKIIGGAISDAQSSSMVGDNFSNGKVYGLDIVGGFLGQHGYNTGGSCGSSYTNLFSNYSTATTLVGTTNVGGFVGNSNTSTSQSCPWGLYNYWDTTTTGTATSAVNSGSTGRTTANMKVQGNFDSNGWDFNYVWSISASQYPALRRDGCNGVYTPIVAASAFAVGSGTAGSPYVVSTVEELALVKSDLSAYYELGQNLDLACKVFLPIGTVTAPFTGSFDGDGKTIANLSVIGGRESEDYVGLFGYISNGIVSNLTLTNAYVAGRSYVGALAGQVTGASSSITNVTSNARVMGVSYVGGLIGQLQPGTATTLSASGGVYAASTFAGGITGYLSTCAGCTGQSLSAWTTNGKIMMNAGYGGGLIGRASLAATLSLSTSNMMVWTKGDYAGGLVAYNTDLDHDRNKSLTRVMDNWGSSYLAGFIGYLTGNVSITKGISIGTITSNKQRSGPYGDSLGGFISAVGASAVLNISDSYRSGALTSSSIDTGGGFIAEFNSTATGSISNCLVTGGTIAVPNGFSPAMPAGMTITTSYWNATTTAKATSGAGTTITDANLKNAATFPTTSGWETTNTWKIVNGATPVLWWDNP